ncbi:MAG TPA: hypothetical protein VFB81_16090 [Myxococcales bacterium]|nr:hypothetical protein [Myxococcales bacterium]
MIRPPIAVLVLAAVLACAGPKGDQGEQGPIGPTGAQGPAGTFSGTFTGNATFTGNVAISGSVTANNLLTTEAFSGWLTNAADFTAPAGGTLVLVKYTDVKQNSNPSVFRMELDGTLTILKPGVVNITASFDAIGPAGYITIYLRLNGNDLAYSLAPANGTTWAQPTVSTSYKASANDAFTVLAYPSQITSMDNGAWSRLSVQWTGVP